MGSEIMFLVIDRLRPRNEGVVLPSVGWLSEIVEEWGGTATEVSRMGGVELAEYGVLGEGRFEMGVDDIPLV